MHYSSSSTLADLRCAVLPRRLNKRENVEYLRHVSDVTSLSVVVSDVGLSGSSTNLSCVIDFLNMFNSILDMCALPREFVFNQGPMG